MNRATRFVLATALAGAVAVLALGCGGSNDNGGGNVTDPGTFDNLNLKSGIWNVQYAASGSGSNPLCGSLNLHDAYADTVCDPGSDDFTGGSDLGGCSVTQSGNKFTFTCRDTVNEAGCTTVTAYTGTLTVVSDSQFTMVLDLHPTYTGDCTGTVPCDFHATITGTFQKEYAGCASTSVDPGAVLSLLAHRELAGR